MHMSGTLLPCEGLESGVSGSRLRVTPKPWEPSQSLQLLLSTRFLVGHYEQGSNNYMVTIAITMTKQLQAQLLIATTVMMMVIKIVTLRKTIRKTTIRTIIL